MSDSFRESPAEREQRIRERADEARPNVALTPGQAETLTKSAAHTDSQGSNTRDLGDSRSPRASSEIGTDALPGPGAPADTAATTEEEA